MPQIDVHDKTGKTVGSVELSDVLFAAPVNAGGPGSSGRT